MSEVGEESSRKSSPSLYPEWDKTILATQRLKEKGLYEEADRESKNGFYLGRPIIGRETPINGGVYVGGGEREAILVDDRNPRSRLNEVYRELLDTMQEKSSRGLHVKAALLSDIFDLVKNRLPYKPGVVNNVARKYSVKPDQKVSLDVYLKEEGGVCRHQALLAAYLLERLRKDRKVGGTVSVDRNFVPGLGGHAWVRYTNSVGEVFVIDPARDLVDRLKDLNPEIQKFYERPKGWFGRLRKR